MSEIEQKKRALLSARRVLELPSRFVYLFLTSDEKFNTAKSNSGINQTFNTAKSNARIDQNPVVLITPFFH